ncbi:MULTISPECIES: hypothetical protein [Paenibacillus]|uniref:Uncharacterized protein n=2 Tax=Paenibacillus lactis TaxID=228574 RepID=G4HD08_9BACL|nr:hypothetical protein [Paenibacillus lactis]EHB65934.1 hypothetical protein PaelaDRAFT_1861 [Paenibacillus lactis 154]MBP1891317.1 hypothetical protein [Paenibacillus lactis]MCM3493767.1 hypothetical protein [Paenibacillus lactis]GIO93914.1 hypothetical protein J31TS3_51410 [Paenibacillus lactis]HAF98311.1 hypothetical protein [Paenibacillus lactis]
MPRLMKFSLIFAAIAAVLYVMIYDFGFPKFPYEIRMSYPAVQYTAEDPSSAVPTTIEIEGTYYRRLFQEPLFDGSIRVPLYDFTMSSDPDTEYPLYRYDRIYEDPQGSSNDTYISFLNYPSYTFKSNGAIDSVTIETLGQLYMKDRFQQVLIQVTRDPDVDANPWFIVAPAATIEEAEQLRKHILP